MSWSAYIRRITAGQSQAEIAAATGISGPTVSRWLSGMQGVNAQVAVKVARAYGEPVLGALVAAGYVTSDEAQERPTSAPSLTDLTDDELVDEIRQRLSQRGVHDDASQEPGSEKGSAAQQSPAAIAWAQMERAKTNTRLGRNNPATGTPQQDPSSSEVSDGDGTTTHGKRA